MDDINELQLAIALIILAILVLVFWDDIRNFRRKD